MAPFGSHDKDGMIQEEAEKLASQRLMDARLAIEDAMIYDNIPEKPK